jgi:hypothetical protein
LFSNSHGLASKSCAVGDDGFKPLPQRLTAQQRNFIQAEWLPIQPAGGSPLPPSRSPAVLGPASQPASSSLPTAAAVAVPAERHGAEAMPGSGGSDERGCLEPVDGDGEVQDVAYDGPGYEYDSDRDGAPAAAVADVGLFEPSAGAGVAERQADHAVHLESDHERDELRSVVDSSSESEADVVQEFLGVMDVLDGVADDDAADEDGVLQDEASTDFASIPPELHANVLQRRLPVWTCPREAAGRARPAPAAAAAVAGLGAAGGGVGTAGAAATGAAAGAVGVAAGAVGAAATGTSTWVKLDYMGICQRASTFFNKPLQRDLHFADAHCSDSFPCSLLAANPDAVRCCNTVCQQVRTEYLRTMTPPRPLGSSQGRPRARPRAEHRPSLTTLQLDALKISLSSNISASDILKLTCDFSAGRDKVKIFDIKVSVVAVLFAVSVVTLL